MRSKIGRPALTVLVLAGALAGWLTAAGAASAQPGPETGGWVAAAAPAGVAAPGAQWITVAGPDGHAQLAAVFRPPGAGPWPVVVVLHGAAGLPTEVLPLARSVADAGFLTVVGCWHAGGPPNPLFARYVGCSDAPSLLEAVYDPALRAPRALVAAARTLPGERADRVGALGLSIGGYPAVAIASSGPGVQAVVAAGGIYAPVPRLGPPLPWYATDAIPSLRAPLLLLHGTADTTIPVQQAREYEQTAREAGALVEAHYYGGVEHDLWFLPEAGDDARRRVVAFFSRTLAGSDTGSVRLPRTGAPGALGAAVTTAGAAVFCAGRALRRPARRNRGKEEMDRSLVVLPDPTPTCCSDADLRPRKGVATLIEEAGMRNSLALRSLLALIGAGTAGLVLAAPAAAVEPRVGGNANCVAQFTSALGSLGVAGEVISGGAHNLQPFGQTVVTVQAQSSRDDCAFDPNDFVPAGAGGGAPVAAGRKEP